MVTLNEKRKLQQWQPMPLLFLRIYGNKKNLSNARILKGDCRLLCHIISFVDVLAIINLHRIYMQKRSLCYKIIRKSRLIYLGSVTGSTSHYKAKYKLVVFTTLCHILILLFPLDFCIIVNTQDNAEHWNDPTGCVI